MREKTTRGEISGKDNMNKEEMGDKWEQRGIEVKKAERERAQTDYLPQWDQQGDI